MSMVAPWGMLFRVANRWPMTNRIEFKPRWITTNEELSARVAEWAEQPYLILDTEFERTNTFFAKPGLIQVAYGDLIYLIDPIKVEDLTPLSIVLESENIEIVLHSMSEDIDLLSHYCQCDVTRVFDTQIAAAFLGYGLSLGYQRLVEAVLGEELDKSETRSDWLQRPLSDDQVYYAAEDVHFLQKVYLRLRESLLESPWLGAVMEEGAEQVKSIVQAYDHPDQAYLKLRGGWDLPLEKQRLVQQLVQWRDETAISRNVPKSWVFSDAVLIELARTLPKHAKQLFKFDRIKPKSVKLYGDEVVSLLESLDRTVPKGFEPISRPIKGKELEHYKQIKKRVAQVAKKNNLESQLIASRKVMESWVIRRMREDKFELPDDTAVWRKEILKGVFDDAL